MVLKISKACLMGGLLLLAGCREYQYYNYKPAEIDALDGKITIRVRGTERLFEKDGKECSEWGIPYRLLVFLEKKFVSAESNIRKMKGENVFVVGERTGTKVLLGNDESKEGYKFEEKEARLSLAFILSDDKVLEYEPYIFNATITVIDDESGERTEKISVRLEPDFRKEKHSDWFDAIMGI